MSSYSVEKAKSGKSGCKKCKEKIAKDDLRIGVHSENGEMAMTSWYHPSCFTVPKKLKITAEDFVVNTLRDASDDGSILPDRKDEIIDDIEAKAPAKKPEESGNAFIAKLAAEYAEMTQEDDADDGGKGKKRKAATKDTKGSASKKKRPPSGQENGVAETENNEQRALELYGEYHKMSGAALKAILKWNRQTQTGDKALLLQKVIDGALHGRLANCGICSGRTKFHEDGTKVICNGSFDEEMRVKIPCDVCYTAEKAPRWLPWFTQEPTKEEVEEMDRLSAEANGDTPADAKVEDGSDLGILMKAAEDLKLDLSDKAATKKTALLVVELLRENGKLDLPETDKAAQMAVGKTILANKGKSAPELVKILADQFGFKEAKSAKAKKKEAAVESSCAVPENAALLLAFEEMAGLYFKEGNRNAGGTYKKVVTAIKDLSFEITKENAMKLSKAGKDKVAGIGAGTSKKMVEFLTTGTMEKLEELRQNAA